MAIQTMIFFLIIGRVINIRGTYWKGEKKGRRESLILIDAWHLFWQFHSPPNMPSTSVHQGRTTDVYHTSPHSSWITGLLWETYPKHLVSHLRKSVVAEVQHLSLCEHLISHKVDFLLLLCCFSHWCAKTLSKPCVLLLVLCFGCWFSLLQLANCILFGMDH